MIVVANIFVGIVAALHLYFLVLEMFLWTRPIGLKTFRQSQQKADDSAVLAANQGLYNGFLAAGLIWGLAHPVAATGFQIKVFFLVCVIVAGLYGGYSVSTRIILIQAVPAPWRWCCCGWAERVADPAPRTQGPEPRPPRNFRQTDSCHV
jgi:putative membrane protein